MVSIIVSGSHHVFKFKIVICVQSVCCEHCTEDAADSAEHMPFVPSTTLDLRFRIPLLTLTHGQTVILALTCSYTTPSERFPGLH
jgi:hypothetical protein